MYPRCLSESDYPQPVRTTTAAAISADSIEWQGKGVYVLRLDGVWVRQNTDAGGGWTGIKSIQNKADIPLLLGRILITDAEASIAMLLMRMGINRQGYYHSITQEDCQMLQAEAERWRIPYTWSDDVEERFFRPARRYFSFWWRID